MKLLAVNPNELMPGCYFCWLKYIDVKRTVVKNDPGCIVYRIENTEGTFKQDTRFLVPVYLVCPDLLSMRTIREYLHSRRVAKTYAKYYALRGKRAERKGKRASAVRMLHYQSEIYTRLAARYEDQITSLLGITNYSQNYPPALPRERWVDTLRCLFTNTKLELLPNQ